MKGQNLLMHQRHSNWPFLMWDWMFKVSADGRWVIFSLARKIKKILTLKHFILVQLTEMKRYLITYNSVSVKRQKKKEKKYALVQQPEHLKERLYFMHDTALQWHSNQKIYGFRELRQNLIPVKRWITFVSQSEVF